jgi:hypothetical protein
LVRASRLARRGGRRSLRRRSFPSLLPPHRLARRLRRHPLHRRFRRSRRLANRPLRWRRPHCRGFHRRRRPFRPTPRFRYQPARSARYPPCLPALHRDRPRCRKQKQRAQRPSHSASRTEIDRPASLACLAPAVRRVGRFCHFDGSRLEVALRVAPAAGNGRPVRDIARRLTSTRRFCSSVAAPWCQASMRRAASVPKLAAALSIHADGRGDVLAARFLGGLRTSAVARSAGRGSAGQAAPAAGRTRLMDLLLIGRGAERARIGRSTYCRSLLGTARFSSRKERRPKAASNARRAVRSRE